VIGRGEAEFDGGVGEVGTFPVINRATCNGTDHCGTTPPVIKVGGKPGPVATDQATDTACVASGNTTTISVTNGDTLQCHKPGGDAASHGR
jgi:hypothetical protein